MIDLSERSVITCCGSLVPETVSSLQSDSNLAPNAEVKFCLLTFLFPIVTVSQSFTLFCLLNTSSTPPRPGSPIVCSASICESGTDIVDSYTFQGLPYYVLISPFCGKLCLFWGSHCRKLWKNGTKTQCPNFAEMA